MARIKVLDQYKCHSRYRPVRHERTLISLQAAGGGTDSDCWEGIDQRGGGTLSRSYLSCGGSGFGRAGFIFALRRLSWCGCGTLCC
jgi:hypothetical protein